MSGIGCRANGVWSAPDRPLFTHPMFVVSQSWFVVGEKDLRHEVAPTSHAGFVEHAFEVLLHGVAGNGQLLGDLGG